MKQRLAPDVRKEEILKAALTLAKKEHRIDLSRAEVAKAAHVSPATVSYHFGVMGQLRYELMAYAIARECWPVIAQGVVLGVPCCKTLPPSVRQKALRSLS